MRVSGTAIAALLLHSSAESFGPSLRTSARVGRGVGPTNRWILRTTSAAAAPNTVALALATTGTSGTSTGTRDRYCASTHPKAPLGYQHSYQTCRTHGVHSGWTRMTATSGSRHHAAARSLSTRGGTSSPATSRATALNSAVANELEKSTPLEVFRKDYRPLPYVVTKINMDFHIEDGTTTVMSELFMAPNTNVTPSTAETQDMVLDGDETCVKLLKLQMNGKDLVEHEVRVEREGNQTFIPWLVRLLLRKFSPQH
jgi:hypothetical protein